MFRAHAPRAIALSIATTLVSLVALRTPLVAQTAPSTAPLTPGRSPEAPTPPLAQSIPDRIGLTVTGNPAAAEYIAARITTGVVRAIGFYLTPSDKLRILSILPGPQPLGSGFLTNFRVPFSIDRGPAASARTGLVTVDVQNAGLPPFLPTQLAFADDPERIVADGVLSRTTVGMTQPTRLYYYHENRGTQRRFYVLLTANDSVRSHIQIVAAAAGPNIDVMSVGHAATKTFLDLQPNNEGGITEITGGKPVIERDTLAGAGDGIVGTLDLRVLDGGPVTVTVLAIPPTADPAAYLYGGKLPDDGHTRHGIFDLSGFAQRIIAYTAGAPDAIYAYGNRRQTLSNIDAADRGRDYGDYGVIHRLAFDLDNPTDVPTTVFLYEKPLGGVVRSSFVVDGKITEVGCARLPKHYLIASKILAPRATDTLSVLAMTDGGSNYPLEIGVSATPPIVTTPPISAPEGCFPKPAKRADPPQPAASPTGH